MSKDTHKKRKGTESKGDVQTVRQNKKNCTLWVWILFHYSIIIQAEISISNTYKMDKPFAITLEDGGQSYFASEVSILEQPFHFSIFKK